jgi:hypothetical protein
VSSDIISSTPVYDKEGNVIGIRTVREAPDGTRTERIEPAGHDDEPPESPADRIWRRE